MNNYDELMVSSNMDRADLVIATPHSRFEYNSSVFEDEIKREFPDCWINLKNFVERVLYLKKKLTDFSATSFWGKLKMIITDVGAFYDIYMRNMDDIYARYLLPCRVQCIFNAVLFVFSGVLKDRYPAITGVRVLSSVLEGVVLDRVNEVCGDSSLHPYSIYMKIKNNLINRCMGRYCIFLECDDYHLLDKDCVYIVAVFKISEEHSVVRVSSFISTEQNKTLKMMDVVKKLMPAVDVEDIEVCLDVKSGDFEGERA